MVVSSWPITKGGIDMLQSLINRRCSLELLGNLLGELYLEFKGYEWEAQVIHDTINIVLKKRLANEKEMLK